MKTKKIYQSIDHTVTELEERIELLDKQFNGVHPIYGEMNKLIGSLRKKVGEIENHILVSFQDWEKLKKAGTELDEIINWNPDHKKVSNRLWEVINRAEEMKEH